MDEQKIIKALEKEFQHQHPHIFKDKKNKSMSIDEWQEKNCPYVWHFEEEAEEYILLIDSGYGWMALIKDNIVIDVGKDFVTNGNGTIIAIGPSYEPGHGLYKRL